jgi:Domain of unknown function (DUF4159)
MQFSYRSGNPGLLRVLPLWALMATLLLVLLLAPELALAQRFPFRDQGSRAADVPADPDGSEFHFARLIYGGDGFSDRFAGRGNSWTTDMPEAEHFFMQGLQRLTLVDGATVSLYSGAGSERINLNEDNVFDYPFLYAVEVGHWQLTGEEAAILRDYLLRGGFLMVDDFHGSQEWKSFMLSMQKVFPDRPVVDIKDDNEVLHVLYDLDERIQIPGLAALYNGVTYEKDGATPTWRGVYDDEGRLLVAINHNMDLGDAWEHADTPEYPENMTAMAYRFAVNYVIYAMTH